MFPSYKESIATIGWLKKNSGALHIHLLRRLVRFFSQKNPWERLYLLIYPPNPWDNWWRIFSTIQIYPPRINGWLPLGLVMPYTQLGVDPVDPWGRNNKPKRLIEEGQRGGCCLFLGPVDERHGSQRGENARGSLRKSHGNYRVSFNKGLGHHPHF